MLKNNEIKELEWKGGLMRECGEMNCPFVGRKVKMYHKADSPAYNTVTNPFLEGDEVMYFIFDEDEGIWKDEASYLCTKEEYDHLERIAYSST